MKAILVVNLPKSCYKCPMMFDDGNGIWCGVERDKDGDMHMRVHYYCGENERPSWCPLKPIPTKKKPLFDPDHCEIEKEIKIVHEIIGYNRCIDEIMGETKNETVKSAE